MCLIVRKDRAHDDNSFQGIADRIRVNGLQPRGREAKGCDRNVVDVKAKPPP